MSEVLPDPVQWVDGNPGAWRRIHTSSSVGTMLKLMRGYRGYSRDPFYRRLMRGLKTGRFKMTTRFRYRFMRPD